MKRSIFCLLQYFKNVLNDKSDDIHIYVDGKFKPDFSKIEITSVEKKKYN